MGFRYSAFFLRRQPDNLLDDNVLLELTIPFGGFTLMAQPSFILQGDEQGEYFIYLLIIKYVLLLGYDQQGRASSIKNDSPSCESSMFILIR